MITQIGTRKDGTVLGEDEAGNFFIGSIKKIGYDEMQVQVTEPAVGVTQIEYSYEGILYSKATLQTITPEMHAGWLEACRIAKDNQEELPRPPSGYRPELGAPACPKQFTSVLVMDATGNVTEQSVEKKFDVMVWEAIV